MWSAIVLAIIAVVAVLTFIISRIEGLAFLAPGRTKRITGCARTYCVDQCREVDGTCPLEKVGQAREDCPLWKFVEADLPTTVYGDPFAYLRTS